MKCYQQIKTSLAICLLSLFLMISAPAMAMDSTSRACKALVKAVVPETFPKPPKYIHGGRLTKKKVREEKNRRLKALLGKKSHLKFDQPLAPEAPEVVLYNWAEPEDNWQNLVHGMTQLNALRINRQEHGCHLGLYLAGDPISCAVFGSILMEVALYKDQYPTMKNGKIHWEPVSVFQFSHDPTSELGAGQDIASLLGFENQAYLVTDLAIVKELRWPDKKIVEQFWKKISIDFEDPTEETLYMPAIQWLLTPNYSLQEMLALFKMDKKKLAPFVDAKSPFHLEANQQYETVSNSQYLFLDGLFRLLLKSEESVFDLITGHFHYQLALLKIGQLNKTEIKALKSWRKNLKETSRASLLLDALLEKNEGALSQNIIEKLHTFLEENIEEYKSYLSYDSQLIDTERDKMEEFIKSSN